MSELRKKMIKEMDLRDFAQSTKDAYVNSVAELTNFCKKAPDQIVQEEIEDYLLHLKNERGLSSSTRNQRTAGLKFFFNQTLKDPDICLSLPRKRTRLKLPEVLSMDEVNCLIKITVNLKHRVLLKTAYSAGLRVEELVSLKTSHIDSSRMLIRVEQGKGRKDRYTILSENLLTDLHHYWKMCHPENWLFPAKDPVNHISTSCARRIFKKAKKKAGITKGQGIHTLRHCFATHLLEMGYDIFKVQKLLGHKSIQSTMIYLHISKNHLATVKSPLDLNCFSDDSKSPWEDDNEK